MIPHPPTKKSHPTFARAFSSAKELSKAKTPNMTQPPCRRQKRSCMQSSPTRISPTFTSPPNAYSASSASASTVRIASTNWKLLSKVAPLLNLSIRM